MTVTRLGLIGLGAIGKTHLYNCFHLQNAQLTAVADISKRALNLAKAKGALTTYRDYHKLLEDPNVDAAIIALPTHLHAEAAQAAAQAGKHVLLEKPLARNPQEGQQILDATNQSGVKLMIGHPARFAQSNRQLKAKIESGELGEIQLAYATNVASGPFTHRAEADAPSPVPEWWWNPQLTGGGALIDLGSHMIDLLRWLFGEVADAKAYLGHRFNLEMEDHAIATLRFEKGQIAIVTVGWFSQQSDMKIEVQGTAGHATTAQPPPSKLKTAIQLMLRRTPDFYLPYLAEVQHFVDCIQRDHQPTPSGQDGLKDLQTIQKAYQNPINLT